MMSFGEKRNDDTASSQWRRREEGGLLEEVKGVRNKC